MCSERRSPRFAWGGFPIRTSPDQCLYTAPRGLSQCPTSFFGTWRLGIHRKLLVASLRDAENSKLFVLWLCFCVFFCALRSQRRSVCYSVGKVRVGSPTPAVDHRELALSLRSAPLLALQPHTHITARQIAGPHLLLPSLLPQVCF